MIEELSKDMVRRSQPIDRLEFGSTADLAPLDEIIGQDRGMSALQFGLELKGRGYNIFVAGPSGTGKKTAIINFLRDMAKSAATPPDWCYVNNFDEPRRPKALRLPAGKGVEFQKNMEWLVLHMKEALTKAFSSVEYAEMRQESLEKIGEERRGIIDDMKRTARDEGFVLKSTPVGQGLIPILDGKEIGQDEYQLLPPGLQRDVERKHNALESRMRGVFTQLAELQKRADAAVDELKRGVAASSMEYLFQMMSDLYEGIDDVKVFLDDIKADIVENLPNLLFEDDKIEPIEGLMERYRVNLLVDNSRLEGAPVVTESHPTHKHIFGYLEKEVRMGVLSTGFTLVRGGSAHRANGGFLIITVEDLFADPHVWATLKLALRNETLEITDTPEPMEFLTTKTLMPEPIPFDAKVILIGGTAHYYALFEQDDDFKDLFKVTADFDTSMDWNDENVKMYSRFVCAVCEKEGLKPMDRSAVAAIIEHGSRLSSDRRKLSTRFGELADFIIEVSYYASRDGAGVASKGHVDTALEERVYRSNLTEKRLEEMVARGVLLVDTEGMKVGQVNGLVIHSTGGYQFGRPNRVTASVGVGKEGVIDIEREANLSGPLHTKGVLILVGYLNEMYAREKPLSLTARIVFEQSYSGIDGDSASSTELYAILSAISGLPIKQHLAVTGSVNQKGEVQAIGGVNEKVEGFYETCKTKGLNGEQGVLIPASNVDNLMLREEVVEAIGQGRFHIYPVSTIDEGIEVLTGVRAGVRLPDGSYDPESINDLVQRRLGEMAERIRDYTR